MLLNIPLHTWYCLEIKAIYCVTGVLQDKERSSRRHAHLISHGPPFGCSLFLLTNGCFSCLVDFSLQLSKKNLTIPFGTIEKYKHLDKPDKVPYVLLLEADRLVQYHVLNAAKVLAQLEIKHGKKLEADRMVQVHTKLLEF
jgi:hypothetical protein